MDTEGETWCYLWEGIGMSDKIRLRDCVILEATSKAFKAEVQYKYVTKDGEEGVASEPMWFPKSQVMAGDAQIRKVSDWILEKKEEELAEKHGYRTVGIITLED